MSGSELLTRPAFSAASAAGTSRKPLPRSIRPELSPKSDGLAENCSALRIWVALDPGDSLRNSAAAPATVGPENEVPETNRMRGRHGRIGGRVLAIQPPGGHDCT